MAAPSDVQYTSAGGPRIGFQEWGDPDGPPVVLLTPLAQNIDLLWEDPAFAAFAASLGTGLRMIWFDARGTGVSDRQATDYALETQSTDVLAVLDAVGIEAAHLVGCGDGGLVALHVAAIAPERARGLVLINSAAGYLDVPEPDRDLVKDLSRRSAQLLAASWGTAESAYLETFSPSRANDAGHVEWNRRYLRQAASPGHIQEMFDAKIDTDPAPAMSHVTCETLVVCNRRDAYVPAEASRWLAAQLDAPLVELDGGDHLPWAGPTSAAIAKQIADFVAAGASHVPSTQHKLACALVCDIDLPGDDGDPAIANRHARIGQQVVTLYDGTVLPSDDGRVVAAFDGAGKALACARQMLIRLALGGIPARTGIHAGEMVFDGRDVSGPALDIAAAAAGAGQAPSLLVTHTVKGLLGGTGVEVVPHQVGPLPAVDGEWALYDADDTDERLVELGYSSTFLEDLIDDHAG